MNPDLPRVYGLNHAKTRFACQYYRIDVPLRGFEKFGYAMTWNDKGNYPPADTLAAMTHSTFDLFWSIGGDALLDQLQIIREMKPIVADGRIDIPPTLIYDIDDNRDYIHPHNVVFCEQGVRAYPDTTLLRPGARLCSIDPNTGKEKVLWEDGVTYYSGVVFDVARNLRNMNTIHKIMRTAHGMTVSTPHLADYVKEVIGVQNVHVFPNTIIPEDYKSYPLKPHKDVRILWQGGASHLIDWFPLRHAIKQICHENPNVKIVIFGQLDEWVEDFIPHHQLEHVQWVDYSAYKLQRGLLQIDINLCPLAANPFNKCKSAIKWYEGSVWDKPEATLAASVPPYSDEMTDGVNGLLYTSPDDFVYKLTKLIKDEELRADLGDNAKKWVLENRTMEKTIPPLWDFYSELHARRIGEVLAAKG